jgi:hypothetical protein
MMKRHITNSTSETCTLGSVYGRIAVLPAHSAPDAGHCPSLQLLIVAIPAGVLIIGRQPGGSDTVKAPIPPCIFLEARDGNGCQQSLSIER